MARGFISGLIWGLAIAAAMVLVATELAVRHQIARGPATGAVDVPVGSGFDGARTDLPPSAPVSATDQPSRPGTPSVAVPAADAPASLPQPDAPVVPTTDAAAPDGVAVLDDQEDANAAATVSAGDSGPGAGTAPSVAAAAPDTAPQAGDAPAAAPADPAVSVETGRPAAPETGAEPGILVGGGDSPIAMPADPSLGAPGGSGALPGEGAGGPALPQVDTSGPEGSLAPDTAPQLGASPDALPGAASVGDAPTAPGSPAGEDSPLQSGGGDASPAMAAGAGPDSTFDIDAPELPDIDASPPAAPEGPVVASARPQARPLEAPPAELGSPAPATGGTAAPDAPQAPVAADEGSGPAVSRAAAETAVASALPAPSPVAPSAPSSPVAPGGSTDQLAVTPTASTLGGPSEGDSAPDAPLGDAGLTPAALPPVDMAAVDVPDTTPVPPEAAPRRPATPEVATDVTAPSTPAASTHDTSTEAQALRAPESEVADLTADEPPRPPEPVAGGDAVAEAEPAASVRPTTPAVATDVAALPAPAEGDVVELAQVDVPQPDPDPEPVQGADDAPEAPDAASTESGAALDAEVEAPGEMNTVMTPGQAAASRIEVNRLPQAGVPEPEADDEPEDAATEDVGEALPGGKGSADDAEPPADALTRNAAVFDRPEGLPILSVVLLDEGALPANLPFPATFALDPADAEAMLRAQVYRSGGHEVVVLPALPEGATAADAAQAMEGSRALLNQAVAIMDRPEAVLQSSREALEQIVAEAAGSGHGLLTIPRGLNSAQRVAQREGLVTGVVFRDIDAEGQDSAAVKRFLDQAAFRARQEGAVIVLARVRPETLAGLAEWVLGNRAQSVALAPLSVALRAGAGL